jgi:hypothetical protein
MKSLVIGLVLMVMVFPAHAAGWRLIGELANGTYKKTCVYQNWKGEQRYVVQARYQMCRMYL